jgi:uncharacterized protein YkwD
MPSPSPTPVVAAPIASTIVTTPPAAYIQQAGSVSNYETLEFNAINTARSTCGFGYLKQNTQLDAAARGHADYLMSSGVFVGHIQIKGTATYSLTDRINLSGYKMSSGSEVVAVNRMGASAVATLLAAPYHAAGLLSGAVDVGVGVKYRSDEKLASFVANYGTPLGGKNQLQAADEVLTYPCQGVTETATALFGEDPHPIPSRVLTQNPIGQPIYVRLLQGRKLVITAVTVTGPTGSVALLPTMTKVNDPNQRLTENEAFIMPDREMAPNSSYSVMLTGTNNGVAFTKNFTFTTGKPT